MVGMPSRGIVHLCSMGNHCRAGLEFLRNAQRKVMFSRAGTRRQVADLPRRTKVWKNNPSGESRVTRLGSVFVSWRLGFARRAQTADGVDFNAEKDWLDQLVARFELAFCKCGLPPPWTLLEQLTCACELLGELGFPQLLVAAESDHAGPMRLASDLVDEQADLWITPHPLDFLAGGAEHVNVSVVVSEVHRHDVWLIVEGTAQTAKGSVGKSRAALLLGHFIDKHGDAPLFRI